MSIEDLGARVVGALWGSLVALLFYPPKTKTEAIRRFVAPTVIGAIAAPVLLYYIGWPRELDYFIASSGAIAFISWFLLPIVVAGSKKLIERAMQKAD
jgi:uncharacterized membrane protein